MYRFVHFSSSSSIVQLQPSIVFSQGYQDAPIDGQFYQLLGIFNLVLKTRSRSLPRCTVLACCLPGVQHHHLSFLLAFSFLFCAMLRHVFGLSALAATVFTQSTTTTNVETTTASLLLGTLTQGFSGTVVSAAPCETVFALTCSGQELCPDPVTVLISIFLLMLHFYS